MRKMFVLLSGVAAVSASHAYAQAKDDLSGVNKEHGLEDIVVSARRTEEVLQQVPVAVTALSQQQITELNIVDAQGLSKLAPSLQNNTAQGSRNSNTPAIRGMGQSFGGTTASCVRIAG